MRNSVSASRLTVAARRALRLAFVVTFAVALGDCSADLAGPDPSQALNLPAYSGLALAWPVPSVRHGATTQEFACHACLADKNGQYTGYHTGIDIPGSTTDVVVAAADGSIVLVQRNDLSPNNCGQTGGCSDHGEGNTVILSHASGLFTQYSHLSAIDPSILALCGATDSSDRTSCPQAAGKIIPRGTALGWVGGTGFGQANAWDLHLHFELKTFPTTGTLGNDNGKWGYTDANPETFGFKDPVILLEQAVEVPQAVITVAGGVSMYAGPLDRGYRQLPWALGAGSHVRVTHAVPTSAACPKNMFRIQQDDGGLFVRGSGPEAEWVAWVCGSALDTPTQAHLPTIANAAASGATATTVVLRATVNPNGAQTNVSFDWGTSASYGNTTPARDVGSGTAGVSSEATLTGLAPSTTYHFRARATGSGGTATSEDATFATASQPVLTTTVLPAGAVTLGVGQSQTYTIAVVDGSGAAVAGATVNVIDPVGTADGVRTTDASGSASWTTTVPSGRAAGTYTLQFSAGKTGYVGSSTVSRAVTVTAAAPMNGTLTLSASSCAIAAGASTCNVGLTWATTNPVATSAITSEWPSGNYTVATGNSGSVSAPVPYGSRNFYLYNSGQLLASKTATASCVTGTNWTGSVCQAPQPTLTTTVLPAGTVTLAPGQSQVYTITVVDGTGSPVSAATVHWVDGLTGSDFSGLTDATGVLSYGATVPSAKPVGSYDISFSASKTGYTSSSTVSRTVTVAQSAQPTLTATVLPAGSVTMSPGQSQTYTVTVMDGGGSAVSGATVRWIDNLAGRDFQGITNANGVLSYQTTVPSSKPVGTYSVSFTASKTGYTSSNAVIRTVTVNQVPQPTLTTTILPAGAVTLGVGQSQTYTITVVDGSGAAIAGATVNVIDPVGTSDGAKTTDASGTASWTTTVPAGRAAGTYTLQFSAGKTGYVGSSTVSRSVTVTAPPTAPSVNSISPTTMTADGLSHTLTVFGSNFQVGNVVQFKWGVGAGAGTWNPGNTPSIANSGQLTVSMNPGMVSDQIYVRVCRSASQTSPSDCSAGTQAVTVTAAAVAPSVSSISPTTMTANGQSHTLTVFGNNFQVGNVVQFKWGVGTGAGSWNPGNTPSVANSGELTVSMNPGTVNDVIYVRVCRSASQTSTADCSAGTQGVTVIR